MKNEFEHDRSSLRNPLAKRIWPGSAAELDGFQEPNDVALIGDDLRLPDDGDGHQAHEQHAKRQRQIGVRLGCGKAKGTNDPGHLISPSTYSAACGALGNSQRG